MRELRMCWIAAVMAVGSVACVDAETESVDNAVEGPDPAECRRLVDEVGESMGRPASARAGDRDRHCEDPRPDDPRDPGEPPADPGCEALVLAVCEELGGDPRTCDRLVVEHCGGGETPPSEPSDPACIEAVLERCEAAGVSDEECQRWIDTLCSWVDPEPPVPPCDPGDPEDPRDPRDPGEGPGDDDSPRDPGEQPDRGGR